MSDSAAAIQTSDLAVNIAGIGFGYLSYPNCFHNDETTGLQAAMQTQARFAANMKI